MNCLDVHPNQVILYLNKVTWALMTLPYFNMQILGARFKFFRKKFPRKKTVKYDESLVTSVK